MSIRKFNKGSMKKVCAAIACSLVVSSVALTLPKDYSASSTNRVDKVLTVAKNAELKDGAEPNLVIELDDELEFNSPVYLELDNAEWLVGDTPSDDIIVSSSGVDITDYQVTVHNKNLISFKIKSADNLEGEPLEAIPAEEQIKINLRTVIGKQSASVTVDPGNTTLTENTVLFAKVAESGMTAKVASIVSLYEGGTLDDITIEESYAGSFKSETRLVNGTEYGVLEIELDSNDYEFNTKNLKVTPVKGFDVTTSSAIKVTSPKEDRVSVMIPKTELDKCTEKGGVRISGLAVYAVDEEPAEGTLSVDISGEFTTSTTSLQVAKIVSTGLEVKVTPANKDYKDFLPTGRTGYYTIDIKEKLEDTLADNRTLDFTLEDGYFFDAGTTSKKQALKIFEEALTLPRDMELQAIDLVDTKVVGFSVVVSSDLQDIDEYTLKVPVSAELSLIDIFDETSLEDEKEEENDEDEKETRKVKDNKDLSKLTLTISGRAISNDEVDVTLTSIKEPVRVEIEEAVYKVGLKDQEGTDIVIKETNPGMIKDGSIYISFDNVSGLSFTSVPTVKVTDGDLKLGKGQLVKSNGRIVGIKFNVSKTSKKASTITISDILVTADRTVPEGKVGIEIGGSAITDNNYVSSQLYARMVASNVDDANQDLTNKVEDAVTQTPVVDSKAVEFTLGSNIYKVNGTQITMDASPYISPQGRVMIPVRYLADALGVSKKQILCNSGIVTVISGSQVIQVKANSNIMVINGAQVPMDEKTTEIQGRTYVPVSFIASALNIDSVYDEDANTVTFYKGMKLATTDSNKTETTEVTENTTTVKDDTQNSVDFE